MARNSPPNSNVQTLDRSHSNLSISSNGTVDSVRTTNSVTSTTSSQKRSGILNKLETGFQSVLRRFSRTRTSLTEMETQILITMTGFTREEVSKW